MLPVLWYNLTEILREPFESNLKPTVVTTNMLIAPMSGTWLRRKVFHPCDGGPRRRTMYLATVDWATSKPSLSSSPWIRGAPQSWFSVLICRISARNSISNSRAPSPRVRFPTPIAAKAGPMPPHQRFRLDNRYELQDRWKPSIHLDEEPAVAVGRLNSTPHPAPQDDQLVSEHRIFRLKPALRLERGGQHGQKKPNQRDHDANLADSSLNKPG